MVASKMTLYGAWWAPLFLITVGLYEAKQEVSIVIGLYGEGLEDRRLAGGSELEHGPLLSQTGSQNCIDTYNSYGATNHS